MPSTATRPVSASKKTAYLTAIRRAEVSYTLGMKTAVSVPDEVYKQAERLARRQGRSRSELYSAAVREYVARHAPDDVTDALDRVVDGLGQEQAAFRRTAAKRVMQRTEW